MGIGVSELFVLFAIVLLIFGTKRLRTVGGDLGVAIREFRSTMHGADSSDTNQQKNQLPLNESSDS